MSSNEPATEYLSHLSANREFRDDLLELLRLGGDKIQQLAGVTSDAFVHGPADKELIAAVEGIVGRSAQDVHSVALYLYRTSRERGIDPNELIDELGRLAHEIDPTLDFMKLREPLLGLVTTDRESTDRWLRRLPVARAGLPVMESAQLFLDFRAMHTGADEGDVDLVPVIVARFEFDEPIAGQQYVAFQIPVEFLTLLGEQVESVAALASAVDRKLSGEGPDAEQ